MTEIMSVVDAIMGLAIKAGSMPSFFASMGSMLPIVFASMMTARMARQTVNATVAGSWSRKMTFAKFSTLRPKPTMKLIRISFHMTFQASFSSISPTAMPRMTSVADWEPELPPVPDYEHLIFEYCLPTFQAYIYPFPFLLQL